MKIHYNANKKTLKNCPSSSYNNNVLKLCITSLDIVSRKNQILENKNNVTIF